MLALYLVAKHIEQPQALLLTGVTRTVILLFKVIDMCTPWSLETRPRSKILAKTLLYSTKNEKKQHNEGNMAPRNVKIKYVILRHLGDMCLFTS
jgi:hypothetical protein